MPNKKLAESNLVDWIPQRVKRCPLDCPECYYNRAVNENTEWIQHVGDRPSDVDIQTKIVRVNSGLDSNIERKIVVEQTRELPHKFYNTSIPQWIGFPGPVVLTVNPGWCGYQFHNLAGSIGFLSQLMFVRVLVADVTQHALNIIAREIRWYARFNVPVVLTFMRYTGMPTHPSGYTMTGHIDHEWWCPTIETKRGTYAELLSNASHGDLYVCGGLEGDERCATCGVCERLYWRSLEGDE